VQLYDATYEDWRSGGPPGGRDRVGASTRSGWSTRTARRGASSAGARCRVQSASGGGSRLHAPRGV